MKYKDPDYETRFWDKVCFESKCGIVSPYTGVWSCCWEWIGLKIADGYGHYRLLRKHLAHRLSYTYFFGVIDEGLIVDHLCGNRSCVNPLHLEAVTQGENIHRSPNHNGNKKFCKNGHEFTPENCIARSDGYKDCLKCRRERYIKRYAKGKR